MKKTLLMFFGLAVGLSVVAQNRLYQPEPITYPQSTSGYEGTVKNSNVFKSSFSELTPEPVFVSDALINTFRNKITDEIIYYKGNSVMVDNNKYFKSTTITLFDKEFNQTGDPILLEFPELTNSVLLYSDCTSDYILVYHQHFVGSVAPKNRVQELWLVNLDGTIGKVIPFVQTVSIFGDKLIIILSDDLYETDTRMEIYDAQTLEFEKRIEVPTREVTEQLADGASLLLKKIDGIPYLGLMYFDQAVFNGNELKFVVEGNHLNVDLYNLHTYEVKQAKVALDQVMFTDPGGTLGWGPEVSIDVAAFPHDKWSISTKQFNDDDKIEFTVGVSYSPYMSSPTTFPLLHYYVVNEDGEVLKKLEGDYVPYDSESGTSYSSALNDIEGENDLAIFTVWNEEKTDQYAVVFDIEKWEEVVRFPAIFNDFNISMPKFRLKTSEGYDLLIPTGNITTDELNNQTGYVLRSNQDGELAETCGLQLGTGALKYDVALYNGLVGTDIFNDDEDLELLYMVVFKGASSAVEMKVHVSKPNQDPIFTWETDSIKGVLNQPGFFYGEENIITHMFLTYSDGNTYYYSLPFDKKGEENSINNEVVVAGVQAYYDAASKTINVNAEDVASVEVYSINGVKVLAAKTSVLSASSLAKGIYIVKVADMQGNASAQKVLVY